MAAEDEREVVRVRAKKCEGVLAAEFRSFAVDPQITSLDVLHHILIRAFDISGKCNFGMSYLCRDRSDGDRGNGEVYLSLLSDWDLDTAFASAAKPCLFLKMDIKPSEDSPLLEGWDIISPKDVIGSDLLPGERRGLATAALPFTQSLLSQVGRTLSRVQQALSWSYGEEVKPFKPPLSDSEFHCFLNRQGQLCRPEELRLRIYHGGVEPSLRKVVWRYLLNVYPDGLTGQERMDYMKRKSREYEQLKRRWPAHVAPDDLDLIRTNVMKDVLRTDRTHPYYAGSEDSPHLTALADLLTTYATTHPQVSYCQGMSDMASPILAVMDNEAHAYICFCGIMKRLEGNFAPDSRLMSLKFQHLRLLLQCLDPEFYAYLESRGADSLLFCYRWLLLELKREFAFDHALRMLEVSWSSLPPDPPESEVELRGSSQEVGRATPGKEVGPGGGGATGEQRTRHTLRPLREGVRAMGWDLEGVGEERGARGEGEGDHGWEGEHEESIAALPPFEKQLSSGELNYYGTLNEDRFDLATSQVDQQASEESEEDLGKRMPLGIHPLAETRGRSSPNGHPPAMPAFKHTPSALVINRRPVTLDKPSIHASPPLESNGMVAISPSTLMGRDLSLGRMPLPPQVVPTRPPTLPPPQELGCGNPFMLFLCVSLLLEHRDHIVCSGLDYNELAMHFDRLVRQQNLARVLHRAKALFAEYLQSEVWTSEKVDEVSLDCPSPPVRSCPSSFEPPSGSASPNSTYNLTDTVFSPSSPCPLPSPS
ncbi:hypothetical protein AAFF_G00260170 [Aldrovandia affinis]|uniref:Rab-GAP TBC domain-containing protein n=1 Tax=Aldrovandia affinis TaxID=143900 RepID=A0AAD7RER0_9TELE|nr:hypothetical protein AAFF_G00260170 [Aldrovandia affinis]